MSQKSRFVLKALSGPIKGQAFNLKKNLILGRSRGDIILQDETTSNPHAEIIIYDSGTIMLVDKDSKNGIFVNGALKVKTILEKGSKFQIGSIEFQVNKIYPPKRIWADFLKQILNKIANKEAKLAAFSEEIHLNFLQGPQIGRKEVLTYGPHCFGSQQVEGVLLEKGIKSKAFCFIPQKESILFQTKYPLEVFFNGESVSKTEIKNKDIITVGKTVIKIKLKTP